MSCCKFMNFGHVGILLSLCQGLIFDDDLGGKIFVANTVKPAFYGDSVGRPPAISSQCPQLSFSMISNITHVYSLLPFATSFPSNFSGRK